MADIGRVCERRGRYDEARKQYAKFENKIEAQSGAVKKKDALLREIEAGANDRRDEFGNLFESKLEGLGEVFADEAMETIHSLRSRLGIISINAADDAVISRDPVESDGVTLGDVVVHR